jgi:hypothetical protein
MAVVNLERKSGGQFAAESGGQYQRKMQVYALPAILCLINSLGFS